jgi:hypothetical protein
MGTHPGNSPVPERADHPVNCNLSKSGKHQPVTKEAVFQGNHIKFKVCKSCGGSLK